MPWLEQGAGDTSATLLVDWWRRQPDTVIVETPEADCGHAEGGADTPRGTWFDESVDLRDPEREALTEAALALVAAVETRTRKRRPIDESNHRTLVCRVLANGLRCHYFRRPALVAYLRKADGYTGGPAWLRGGAMSRTVDLLAKAGLLSASVGRWRAASSTYVVTDKLCGVAQACGITDHSLTYRLPLQRLVRVREGGSGSRQMDFRPQYAGEALRWAVRLSAYNDFVARQDIGLALTPEEEAEWVRHWNEKRKRKWDEAEDGCRLSRPERFRTDLYRQFNHGCFKYGGRLYGGWWIDTPKTLRPKITINGQPTVELDFSGCSIRMLYHERGVDFEGDPYRLDDITAYEARKGLPPGHFREAVKAMTQALINDQNGKETEMIQLPAGLSFWPTFRRRQVRQMIEDKHAQIKDAFGTGAGLRLQRLDSDLAIDIVSELMKQGVPALPIHDSFLVDRRCKFKLRAVMTDLYLERIGFYPDITTV